MATVSQLVLTLALGAYVLEATGSGWWVSACVALSFAPYAVLSSAAGVLADRRSRSTVLLGSCLLRLAASAGLLVGLLGSWPVPVLVALAALVAVAATPSYPALAAAVPQCVAPERRAGANALVTCAENAAWMAGPGAYGVLVACGVGPRGAVAVAVVGFALAAGAVGAVALGAPPRADLTAGWRRDLAEVVALVVRRPALRVPLLLATVDNLLFGYLVVAVVLLARTDVVAGFNAALTVGALVAMTAAGRLVERPEVRWLVALSLLVFGGAVAATGLLAGGTGTLPVVVLLGALAGATTLVAEVGAVHLLQDGADPAHLARVFGLYDQVNVGAIAVGSLLAGPTAALFGAGLAPVVVGGLGAAAAVLLSGRRTPAVPDPAPALGLDPCPPTSSSSRPSTSRAVVPSSSSRVLPAQRRPSAIPSRLP